MAEYLSPGVYVEEFESGSRPIEGISTSTAGFIGLATKGATVGAPELVTSFADFQRKFGGLLNENDFGEYRYMPLSVEQFFVNGGSRAFVMRVAPTNAKCAFVKTGVITVTARNVGSWGNTIIITAIDASRAKLQLTEQLDDNSYRAKSTMGVTVGDELYAVKDGERTYNRIVRINEDVLTFAQPFGVEVVDTSLVCKNFVYTSEATLSIKWDNEIENYENISLNPASLNFISKRFTKSRLVGITVEGETSGNVVEAFGGMDGKAYLTMDGGFDGSVDTLDAGTFIGEDKGPGKRTGIQSFLENNHVNIMAVPGITIPEVLVTLVAHCENMGNRFAVLDMPRDAVKIDDIMVARNLVDSSFAAFYHPWVQVYDRANQKSTFVPPSGAIMGVYARSDIQRGVHKAPANETVNCTGLSCYYNKGEQDLLNPAGVNLIREFPGQGIRVWGARTASSNVGFKYVNVRRLFIYIEESIKLATNWVVFEPNNEMLWGRVQRTIEGFLTTLWRTGALMGTAPGEAFYVDVSRNTMTNDDIQNGRLICVIGVAPSKPAEFVIFRITQIVDSASAQ